MQPAHCSPCLAQEEAHRWLQHSHASCCYSLSQAAVACWPIQCIACCSQCTLEIFASFNLEGILCCLASEEKLSRAPHRQANVPFCQLQRCLYCLDVLIATPTWCRVSHQKHPNAAGETAQLKQVVTCCSLPSLLERVFPTPMGGPGLQVFIQVYNTIFLFVFVCVSYGIVSPAPPLCKGESCILNRKFWLV